MQVIPSIDLRDGACVQLVGGSYDEERVRIADPVAVAEDWLRLGFDRIHLVDLDAATGKGDRSNHRTVKAILHTCIQSGLRAQCGGGVRDLATIADLLVSGASEVVVGTRAVEDRAWLEQAVSSFPNRIIVAADARNRRVVTRGWSETASHNVIEFVDELATLPLAAILVTVVEREGRMEGPDIALMREIALRSGTPIQASGGVRNVADLHALAEAGASAAVVGMALYTGALNPQTIIEEFAA